MTDTPELERLALYRLEHDLTWAELADEMQQAGYPLQARALHNALTHRLQGLPTDRTLFKIRRFVALLDQKRSRKTARGLHGKQSVSERA